MYVNPDAHFRSYTERTTMGKRYGLLILALAIGCLVYWKSRHQHEAEQDWLLDFQYDPVERFDLESVKYSWILTAVVGVLLVLAIGL